MPITSYSDLLPGGVGYPGQLADIRPHVGWTGINAESAAIIPFGRGVTYASVASGEGFERVGLVNLSGSGNTFVGVAIKTDLEKISGTPGTDPDVSVSGGVVGYPVDYTMTYITEGTVYVEVNGTVTPTSAVYCVYSGSGDIGKFRADNTNALAVTTARFLGYGEDGDTVALSLNKA
jgi:hypothetical protein